MFHPFTLLFYVSNLCFTCGRMACLFKVIMSEREIKLRAIFAWCMACEWSVADLYFLFSKIYYVISYRKAWTDASTPESTALAAWSRDVAIRDLHEFMKVRCFPDEIRMAVIWLYNH